MQVRNTGEALYIACEMEKRAVRLYERALVMFADGPCQAAIRAILADERRHLAQFSQMGVQEPGFERAQALSAQAAGVLFSGGLMEAQRKGAFSSVKNLYAYAAEEEKDAIRSYGEFAKSVSGPAAQMFRAIESEEKQHLMQLNGLLFSLEDGEKNPDI